MSIKTRTQTIKTHVVEHKEAYIVGAVGVVGIVITAVVATKMAHQVAVKQSAQNNALVNYRPEIHQTQNNTYYIPPKGHPGFLIVNEDGSPFAESQNEAAKKLGVSAQTMREHLRGEIADIDGNVYRNLGLNHGAYGVTSPVAA